MLHDVSNNGRGLEAYTTKKPYVAADVFSRHRSPDIEGKGVKWCRGVSVPCRFSIDFGNLRLGDSTMGAKGERR